MDASTDRIERIERSILIHAPRARVWRALSEPGEFGRWFGVDLQGQVFAPGRAVQGRITHAGYEHLRMDMVIDRMEPDTLLSWRWHPYAVEQGVDYTKEEPTLVTFTLEDAPGGTLVTVVESGFDKVPPHRRQEAFRMNGEGWEAQMQNIRNHVAAHA